ncbi:MAG: hypothetical protein KAR19_06780 [Bacteroidales bacterium]|nr:hypothetical protein [Bacteroidales bacterium]
MRFPRNLIISSLLCLLATSAQAQLISVMSQVSSDSMMIGDQVIFNIHVEAAENIVFTLPLVKDTLNSNIEVLFSISSDTTLLAGRQVVDHSYMITGFEQGMQLVPPQPVVYTFDNTTDTALSMPLIIHVIEPAVDTTQQIKPIKPPINTPLTFKEVLPWIALGMGGWMLATLIIALAWMYRQRSKDPKIFAIKPQEPAHVIAFRELDRLKEEKIWESGQIKQFYTRLTEITRHYIERQYGIPAMERTTGEILDAFRKSNIEDSLLDEMLKELLELSDLVKFAKEDPLPVDNQTNLNAAYLFVQKTYSFFYSEKLELKEEDMRND